jgi:predicted permease
VSRRERMMDELDEDIREHIEREAQDNIARGMRPDEARRAALLKFGNMTRVTEATREVWSRVWLERLLQDVAYGWRMLRKHPGFTLVAVLTLALGIGAGTAVFSVVNGILVKRLPYTDPEKIVMLWWQVPVTSSQAPGDQWPWSLRDVAHFSARQKSFRYFGAFKSDFFNLVGSGEPDRLNGLRATAGFFAAVGVAPALGRIFTPADDRPENKFVVILSNRLWREKFSADRGIVGRAVALNGQSYNIIGVMPPAFSFPRAEEMPVTITLPPQIQLWVPLEIPPAPRGPSEYGVIGKLNQGITAEQAAAELRLYGDDVAKEFPSAKGWYEPSVVPLPRQVVGDTREPLLLMLAAVGVLLLIASSNVASLVLARSLGRKQEFVLRGALGAGRVRLLRQLLTESLLLGGIGAAAGILVAQLALFCVRNFGPSNIPRLQEATLDPRVLLFTVGITLVTGIVFGLVPAVGISRENLEEAVKDGGRAGRSRAHSRLRNILVVAQVALALVLVISAGLLVRTFHQMLTADSGFNASRVLTFQLSLPNSKYAEPVQMAQVYTQSLLALQALPGVRSAGLVSEVPMGGSTDSTVLRVPDHPPRNENDQPFANYSFASPEYFSAIGSPLLRGRDFLASDTAESRRVTIINSAMAAKYWPGQDPLGREVGVKDPRWPTRTIVGIVANIKHGSLREAPDPEMYVPYTQNEIKIWPSMQTMQAAVRTQANDPASLTRGVREALRGVDADLPIANVTTLATLVDDSTAQTRFALFLVGSFAGLALILATIGLYGVVSYSVQQRTHEIGIRISVGATRRDVLKMVLGSGARLAGVGIIAGLLAAWAVTRMLSSFLYGVRPTDPLTFTAVAALLLGVALLACYLPARRAAEIDPLVALKYE